MEKFLLDSGEDCGGNSYTTVLLADAAGLDVL